MSPGSGSNCPPRLNRCKGSDHRLRVGADALDHRPHPVGPLRREMLLEAQFTKQRLSVGRQDFTSGAVGIERKRNGDKAAHQMGIAVPPIMEHPLAVRALAVDKLQPHLADATANLVRIVMGGLAQGLERAAEFEDIAIAVFPIVEEGKVAADCVDACQ